MGSQTLEILRQGVWASLTGGWFYDPHQTDFCNAVHLYLWLLLLCAPFTLYLCAPPGGVAWVVYCACIGVLFGALKAASYVLHHIFDTCEGVQEAGALGAPSPSGINGEGIELTTLRPAAQVAPPSGSTGAAPDAAAGGATDADSIESGAAVASDDVKPAGSTIDLKVDVHRKNSSESSDELRPRRLHGPPTQPEQPASANTLPGERRHSAASAAASSRMPGLPATASTASVPLAIGGAVSLELPEPAASTVCDPHDTGLLYWKQQKTRHSSLEPPSPSSEPRVEAAGGSQTTTRPPAPAPSTSSLRVRSAFALPELMERDGCGFTLLRFPLVERPGPGAGSASQPPRKSLPAEHFARMTSDVKSHRPPTVQKRKGPTKKTSPAQQQQQRRSQSPATSDGDVSSSPSVGSDDDDDDDSCGAGLGSANCPRNSLSVWIAEERLEPDRPSPQSVVDLKWLFEEGAGVSGGAGGSDSGSSSARSIEAARLLPPEPFAGCGPRAQGAVPKRPNPHRHFHHSHPHHFARHALAAGDSESGLGKPVPIPRIAEEAVPADETRCPLTVQTVRLVHRRRPYELRRGPVTGIPAPVGMFGEASGDEAAAAAAVPSRRHRQRRLKRATRAHRSAPRTSAAARASAPYAASSFEDTADGATHWFHDELGNLCSYTFDERGAARPLRPPPAPVPRTVLAAAQTLSLTPPPPTLESGPALRPRLSAPIEPDKTKHYYNLRILPWKHVKVRLERLALLALLDRDASAAASVLSVALAVGAAAVGAALVARGLAGEAGGALALCAALASAHFSMVKSVQPDAASPTHGHNRLVAFSRPVYFCLLGGAVLALDVAAAGPLAHASPLSLYGIQLNPLTTATTLRDALLLFLLCFPIVFCLGLLPQVTTFAMHVMEQVEMHVFGGNATSGLGAAAFCIARSCLSVAPLFGLAWGGLAQPKGSQHFLFSMFCGLLTGLALHLSRSASDPSVALQLLRDALRPRKAGSPMDPGDPLPEKLRRTVLQRLRSDALVCPVAAVFVFGIHCSSVFSALQPEMNGALLMAAAGLGFLLHYVTPQLRKQLPFLCFAGPFLKSHEHNQFEVREAARVTWFEKIFLALSLVERHLVHPALWVGAVTEAAPRLVENWGSCGAALLVSVCGLRAMRSALSQPEHQYLVLTFASLLCRASPGGLGSETLPLDAMFVQLALHKLHECLLKLRFVLAYVAPWQITWGSPFHAFAQPFSVPHSAMLFLQAFVSSVVSAPLVPFLGSAIFVCSYVRPVRFWERDYKTRRVDHSNTRLSAHLERNLGADDNNLNSIFYEHLTRSLQHSLAGDLQLGRWGLVSQGDCFVLASDYLNCLVHVVEMGNGLVTFQVRGLEFRGTYCQQREVEAISEGVDEDDGCCCCEPGHLPHVLSVNAAFGQRWLAWEVAAAKYVLEGYSISDNSAVSMLQVFDFRKVLVGYYVKSIIFYAMRSIRLEEWLRAVPVREALRELAGRGFVDLDPVFNVNVDDDYDYVNSGVTRNSFCNVYLRWIQFCARKREKPVDAHRDSAAVSLCFALSLVGRRALGSASHSTASSVEFFLHGLHALFKGDFRIASPRDEWIFTDMDLLRQVIAPGVRMSLKLHQDHFMSPDEYEQEELLFAAISSHERRLVISHEGDPAWRSAVLAGTPSLLALRHALDDGADEYKVIMLNKRFLGFRLIKVNRECVRGLWAGQQHELVFLRNRNPERGSIQNAKQVLRNIINSSCDQPIGYPIYVSPLTTSYAETNEQLRALVGGPVSVGALRGVLLRAWRRLRARCSGPGSAPPGPPGPGSTDFTDAAGFGRPPSITIGPRFGASKPPSISAPRSNHSGSLPEQISLRELEAATAHKEPEPSYQRARIVDPSVVYDTINMGRRIDVVWPSERMQTRGGRSFWRDWLPERGMEGPVVHRWLPGHREPARRSHVDRTILLLQVDDKFVPIAESGVQMLAPTPDL